MAKTNTTEQSSDTQVTEYKIPWMIGHPNCRTNTHLEISEASFPYTDIYSKAQRKLSVAWDISIVLKEFLNDGSSGDRMRIGSLVKIIEKQIEKCYDCIDEGSTQYRNLFLAYFIEPANSTENPKSSEAQSPSLEAPETKAVFKEQLETHCNAFQKAFELIELAVEQEKDGEEWRCSTLVEAALRNMSTAAQSMDDMQIRGSS